MRHHTATTCACCGQRSLQLTTTDAADRAGLEPTPLAGENVIAAAQSPTPAVAAAAPHAMRKQHRSQSSSPADHPHRVIDALPARTIVETLAADPVETAPQVAADHRYGDDERFAVAAPEQAPEREPEPDPEPDAALADAILLAEDLAQRADTEYADAPLTFLTLALSRQLTLAADFADAGVDVRALRRGLHARVQAGAFRSPGNRDHESAIVDLLIATVVAGATTATGATGVVTARDLIAALVRCQRKHAVLDLIAGRADATQAADAGAGGLSADAVDATAEAPEEAARSEMAETVRRTNAVASERGRVSSCSAQIDDLLSTNRRLEDRIAAMEKSLATLTRQLSAMQFSDSRWRAASDGGTRASDHSETQLDAHVGADDRCITGQNRCSRWQWQHSSRNRRSARLKRWWSRGRTRMIATSARGFSGRFHRERRGRVHTRTETREAGPHFHLHLDDPVVDAPSIGPKTAARLERVGVWTVRDLLKANAAAVSERVGMRHITTERVRDWQDQARLVLTVPSLRGTHAQLLVGAGFRAATELAGTETADVLAGVLRFSQTRDGQRVLRDGEPPADDRIRAWVAAAQNCEPQRAQI